MSAPAVEQVLDLLSAKLEAVEPTLKPRTPFKAIIEDVQDDQVLPVTSCLRRFNLLVQAGSDDSAEGRGVLTPGKADRRIQVAIRIAYPRSRADAQSVEKMIASDGEHAMRQLGRGARFGDPIQRAALSWQVDRTLDAKLVLVLALVVQYRDAL